MADGNEPLPFPWHRGDRGWDWGGATTACRSSLVAAPISDAPSRPTMPAGRRCRVAET